MFVKLDRELKHGVSRRLILNVLEKMKAIESEQERLDFLNQKSPNSEIVTDSITLKDFLITIERKASKNRANELYFVDEFINLIREEKLAVSFLLGTKLYIVSKCKMIV